VTEEGNVTTDEPLTPGTHSNSVIKGEKIATRNREGTHTKVGGARRRITPEQAPGGTVDHRNRPSLLKKLGGGMVGEVLFGTRLGVEEQEGLSLSLEY